MKVALLSDLHLSSKNPICRRDDLVKQQWVKLDWVYTTAIEHHCEAVLIAGDICDIACSWALLPDVMSFFRVWQGSIQTCIVYGQHDTYMYDAAGRRKTIIGAAVEAGLVTALAPDQPTRLDGSTFVYGCSYGQTPNPAFNPEVVNILVIHAPIACAPLFPGHEYTDAQAFLKQHKEFQLVLCGDIHRTFTTSWQKRLITNTGPLLRRTADLVDHAPLFSIYDAERCTIGHLGVPFVADVIDRAHLERQAAIDALIDPLVTPAGGETTSLNVSFGAQLKEVAAANREKITPRVRTLIAEITGLTMEEPARARSATQKPRPSQRLRG